MLVAVIIILVIIIGILVYQLHKKTILDTTELTKLSAEVANRNAELSVLQENIAKAQRAYSNALNEKNQDLDAWETAQRAKRQQFLDDEFHNKQSVIDIKLMTAEDNCEKQIIQAENNLKEKLYEISLTLESAERNAEQTCAKYQALLQPIQLLEKEKQDRLFYTIQIPDEYKEDIEYLLTTVAPFIKHPDIISKLVWSEYLRPYMIELINRVHLKDEPGIYKITNIDTGKAYVGKSTNLKNRVVDHFKSAIGIKSIADQAVHHEILRTGFWNWAIEPIIYCEKEQLNDLEKYYIETFQTQVWGYNKTKGG